MVFLVGVPVAIIISVVWPRVQAEEYRLAIWAGWSVIQLILTALWSTVGGPPRRWVYRTYYRLRGPRCDLRVRASTSVESCLDDKDLLDVILRVIRNWDNRAREQARLHNRSVVLAGHRTIVANVEDMGVCENDPGDDAQTHRWGISIDVTGYVGRLTQVDGEVETEIRSLMESLSSPTLRYHDGWVYTLDAQLDGDNPFLWFYLRNVPQGRGSAFTLDIREKSHGNQTNIKVLNRRLNISSRSYSSLVDSARRYLASPALSNPD